MRVCKEEFDITPNYTTNGMFVDWSACENQDEVNLLLATKKYCGGVAISCHPHLKKYWTVAARQFTHYGIKLNFHHIISDKESIDNFMDIYNEWKDKVDYFVLLPYGNVGRAPHKEIDWEYLVTKLPEDASKIAFGANFYPYLKEGDHNIKISLYEPEIMSKFLTLEDMSIYPSSFSNEKIN